MAFPEHFDQSDDIIEGLLRALLQIELAEIEFRYALADVENIKSNHASSRMVCSIDALRAKMVTANNAVKMALVIIGHNNKYK